MTRYNDKTRHFTASLPEVSIILSLESTLKNRMIVMEMALSSMIREIFIASSAFLYVCENFIEKCIFFFLSRSEFDCKCELKDRNDV